MQRAQLRFTGGLNRDLPPEELPPDTWSDVDNIQFYDGLAEKSGGDDSVMEDASFTDEPVYLYPYTLTSGFNEVGGWLYHAGAPSTVGKWFWINSVTKVHTNITPTLPAWGPFASKLSPSVCELNRHVFVADGGANGYYFDSTAPAVMTALPGYPATVKVLRAHGNHLFALRAMPIGGAAGDEQRVVRWSDAAPAGGVPATFVPAVGNQAGSVELSEGGAIMEGASLRRDFFIYGEHATWAASYVGGLAVYSFRPVFTDFGCMAKDCVAHLPEGHVVLTRDDVIFHDGARAQSIVNGRMRKEIFGGMYPGSDPYCYAVYVPHRREVWVCVPRHADANEVTMAYIWDIEGDQWGQRDLYTETPHIAAGRVWESSAGPDPEIYSGRAMIADRSGTRLLVNGVTNQHGGFNFSSTVTRSGLDLGARGAHKQTTRIYPRIEGTPGTVLSVAFNGDVIGTGPVNYTLGTDTSLGIVASGELFTFTVTNVSSNADPWRVTGVDVDFTVRGPAF